MNLKNTLLSFITALVMVIFSTVALAVGGGSTFPHDSAPVNLDNKASLARGAKLYVNYCIGCHSLQFQRYNRLAKDLDLDAALVEDNLILTPDTKIGDTMRIAMSDQDGEQWFGALPPDLSVIARARGADYIYNYLRAFYVDESRPLGVNNTVLQASAMPHVLWELQGWQAPKYAEDGKTVTGFELIKPGAMTPDEFDDAMADLTNFLVYVGEPIQQERKRVGAWVLLYLLGAAVLFYLLKREYWRDVH